MAKIKASALIADARGSIAGVTFSKNRAGSYARQKVSPVQPRTIRQMTARARFAVLSQKWRNLTPTQRGDWNDWASNHPIVDVFGNSLVLAGNAAFLRVNADLLNLGIPMTETPLADPTTPPIAATNVSAAGASGNVCVTFSAAPPATNVYGIWTTRGLSLGVEFVDAYFRFAGRLTCSGTEPAPMIIPTALNPLLAFMTGQKLGCIVARYSDVGAYIDSTLYSTVAV